MMFCKFTRHTNGGSLPYGSIEPDLNTEIALVLWIHEFTVSVTTPEMVLHPRLKPGYVVASQVHTKTVHHFTRIVVCPHSQPMGASPLVTIHIDNVPLRSVLDGGEG